MFGWFQRRKHDQAELSRAYDAGQRAAQQFAGDLENLIEVRFRPACDHYLGVLQKQLNNCLNPTDGPPIVVARIEYAVFLENVDKLREKMKDEITVTLSSWLDMADQMQSRDKFSELIHFKVQEFCRQLTETGLQRLLDMAHAMKVADDEWRTKNPELSAKFPS
jgi:hypothetical protein